MSNLPSNINYLIDKGKTDSANSYIPILPKKKMKNLQNSDDDVNKNEAQVLRHPAGAMAAGRMDLEGTNGNTSKISSVSSSSTSVWANSESSSASAWNKFERSKGDKSRSYVDHTYRDYSMDEDGDYTPMNGDNEEVRFPVKLYSMIEYCYRTKEIVKHNNGSLIPIKEVIQWKPHGRVFYIRPEFKKILEDHVLPKFFQSNSFLNFQRQLNMYGFKHLMSGYDKLAYYNEFFLRTKPGLTSRIKRIPRKENGYKPINIAEHEPKFEKMPWLPQYPIPDPPNLNSHRRKRKAFTSLGDHLHEKTQDSILIGSADDTITDLPNMANKSVNADSTTSKAGENNEQNERQQIIKTATGVVRINNANACNNELSIGGNIKSLISGSASNRDEKSVSEKISTTPINGRVISVKTKGVGLDPTLPQVESEIWTLIVHHSEIIRKLHAQLDIVKATSSQNMSNHNSQPYHPPNSQAVHDVHPSIQIVHRPPEANVTVDATMQEERSKQGNYLIYNQNPLQSRPQHVLQQPYQQHVFVQQQFAQTPYSVHQPANNAAQATEIIRENKEDFGNKTSRITSGLFLQRINENQNVNAPRIFQNHHHQQQPPQLVYQYQQTSNIHGSVFPPGSFYTLAPRGQQGMPVQVVSMQQEHTGKQS